MTSTAPERAVDRAVRVRRLLDAYPWSGETPSLRLLGFHVVMRTSDAALARYLSELYEPLRAPGPAAHSLSLLSTRSPVGSRYLVHRDAVRILDTFSPAIALAHLLWEANRQAIEHTDDMLLVHAAGVARGDAAVLLTGPMGAGKSTLAAALVRDGLAYLTDEIIAIDPANGEVRPYPKPISLGSPGSHVPAALATLRPATDVDEHVDTYVGDQWLIAPHTLRADAIGGPSMARVLVAPRYEPRATASLEPMASADALVTLAEHTFHLARHGQRGLDALAAVVASSVCVRLVSGDPDTASELLRSLLDDVALVP